MHMSRVVVSGLFLGAAVSAVFGQSSASAPASSPALAGVLANDARDLLRDPSVDPVTAAQQSVSVLQFAARLDAGNLRVWRLLAETARLAGRTDVERESLRRIIAADAGDLVAQVRYIDLLAADAQTVEARAGVYQNALKEPSLNVQIRSEMAVRLARLAENRADVPQQADYLGQALRLNSVNIAALRDVVRIEASRDAGSADHLKALVALLSANPLQPDAWLETARLAEAAGLHDRAADFLQAALEQSQLNGMPPSGEQLTELALEQATAGQRVKALELAGALSSLPDAPFAPLMIAETLAQFGTPAASQPATSGPATRPDRPAEIRKRLATMAGDLSSAPALADAAGADLTIFSAPGPETANWVEAYAKLVAPDDATLARLRGWLAFRQGKLDEALAQFGRAPDDPLARVGRARVLIAQGRNDQAKALLQELWNTSPTGILALQASLAAAKLEFAPVDSASARAARRALAPLTPAYFGMHNQIRDAVLMSVSLRKNVLGPGESDYLVVRITNLSTAPLPVGPEGVIKSAIGLAAAVRTPKAQALGIYALEDIQRVYRLEPRQIIETTLRVDQGTLADVLRNAPDAACTATITAVSAPLVMSGGQFGTGAGGLALSAGDIERARMVLAAPADLSRLAQEIGTFTGDKQLASISAAGVMLGRKPDDARVDLAPAFARLLVSPDAGVRAAGAESLPLARLTAMPELEQAADALQKDADPLVRLCWARRAAALARAGDAPAGEALRQRAEVEPDADVKAFLQAAVATLKPPAGASAPK